MKSEHIIKVSSCVFSLNVLFRQDIMVAIVNDELELLSNFYEYLSFKSLRFMVVNTINLFAPCSLELCKFSKDLNF